MGFKLFGIIVIIYSVSGLQIGYQPQIKTIPIYKQLEYEHHVPIEYSFAYGVHDEHTGDIKSQHESRKGDVVKGRYELIDSDGHKRIVEYTADKHNGFNAIVHREPISYKIPTHHKILVPVKSVPAGIPSFQHYSVASSIPQNHYSSSHETSHVSFHGPSGSYHY